MAISKPFDPLVGGEEAAGGDRIQQPLSRWPARSDHPGNHQPDTDAIEFRRGVGGRLAGRRASQAFGVQTVVDDHRADALPQASVKPAGAIIRQLPRWLRCQ